MVKPKYDTMAYGTLLSTTMEEVANAVPMQHPLKQPEGAMAHAEQTNMTPTAVGIKRPQPNNRSTPGNNSRRTASKNIRQLKRRHSAKDSTSATPVQPGPDNNDTRSRHGNSKTEDTNGNDF